MNTLNGMVRPGVTVIVVFALIVFTYMQMTTGALIPQPFQTIADMVVGFFFGARAAEKLMAK